MFELNGLPILADELDILNELKNQLALNGVFRFKEFRTITNHIQCTCPMHKNGQESSPSCGIATTNIKDSNGRIVKAGTFHCFTCGYKGSLEETISLLFGHEDDGQFGREWLAKNFVTMEVEKRTPLNLNFDRNSNSNSADTTATEYITEEELDSYRVIHPYMYTRKLTDDIIELFDIGYDNDFILQNKKGYTNHYRCITFPVRDIEGHTLFIARRCVDNKIFHYPEGVTKPVYGLYELNLCYGNNIPNKLYICESMLDALTLWTHGKPAVALNGLGTPYQFKQLLNLPVRNFVLATDSDKAGMKARNAIAKALQSRFITQVIFPKGRKDVNECSYEEIENLKEEFFLYSL